MKRKLFGILRNDRRGLALITVLGVVTLATILIVALFSLSDNELRSAKSYNEGATARLLADNVVELVKSQIQSAAVGDGVPGADAISWSSQPGAVKVYNEGAFVMGRKLYSAENMIHTGAEVGVAGMNNPVVDIPPATWATLVDEWVDLNAPVASTNALGVEQYTFPIVDPRIAAQPRVPLGAEALAGEPPASQGPEGFAITAPPGLTPSGIVPAAAAALVGETTARLPMPVRWLYILQDGSFCTLNQLGPQSTAVFATGVNPTVQNPIVGRVAFWTDDESCKININTAGEPTVWQVPSVFSERDYNWANNQPAYREFQRFPGHPATVAISSVLAPGFVPDPTVALGNSNQNTTFPAPVLAFKEAIYGIQPKISVGGSLSGTLPYTGDDFQKTTAAVIDFADSVGERLYSSVDEYVFTDAMAGGVRTQAALNTPAGANLLDANLINAKRFFLTAHSKAPEINRHGTPRVAIWPIPDIAGREAVWRTGWDNSIAGVSTLEAGNTYYFSRRNSKSESVDLGIGTGASSAALVRNATLLNYLYFLMGRPIVAGKSFVTKYGDDDASQILVQIFDYIRCTNLYDPFLADLYLDKKGRAPVKMQNFPSRVDENNVWNTAPTEDEYYTYTNPRFFVQRNADHLQGLPPQRNGQVTPSVVQTGMYAGHGQVTPILWVNSKSRGKSAAGYKGFGRMITISEVALHLIATADGKPDAGSWVNARPGGVLVRSGGKTAQRINENVLSPDRRFELANPPSKINDKDGQINTEVTWERWYSNLPPYPTQTTFTTKWGCASTANGQQANSISRHPGNDSFNWNLTLDRDTPLLENQKRVQAMLQIETFVPSAGWTKYAPEFTLKLDPNELQSLRIKTVNGETSLFENRDTEVKSNYRYMCGLNSMQLQDDIYANGGHYAPGALTRNRLTKGVGQMPDDSGYSETSAIHGRTYNYPLVSKFFTVNRYEKIKFSLGSELKIQIHDSHSTVAEPIQTVAIKLPQNESDTLLPMPHLVVHSTEKFEGTDINGRYVNQPAVHACRWWCFNRDGAIGRFTGIGNGARPVAENNLKIGMRGRLFGQNHLGFRVKDGRTLTGGTFYGFSATGNGSAVKSRPSDLIVSGDSDPGNLFRSFSPSSVPNMGEYAYYGSDVIRSLIPQHGDYRIVAAKINVPGEMWKPHPVWERENDVLFAHSFSSFRSNSVAGYDTGVTQNSVAVINDQIAKNRLIKNAWYPIDQFPDTPLDEVASNLSEIYGDFDTGPGNMRDGAYINKPDDGNLSRMQVYHEGSIGTGVYDYRNAYFTDSFLQVPVDGAFGTPNKIVSSPVMFGSLPTGVWGSLSDNQAASIIGVPFRTLLFRPATTSVTGKIHTGGPASATNDPATDPADHYLLDLFWMPVVEPYAISNNYATAGKININYHILPFLYIQRATGIYAALKGEKVTALSHKITNKTDGSGRVTADVDNTLSYKNVKDGRPFPNKFWTEDEMPVHLPIDIFQTVNQMNDFALNINGAFRTASQFCEIHLIPFLPTVGDRIVYNLGQNVGFFGEMSGFWNNHRLTGDNLKERPYANIYQKITNRSNTYRVHFIAQSIRKAKSLAPNQFSSGSDQITGEFKGSALFERYLQVTNGNVDYPDYAAAPDPTALPSMETLYRYRTIEMKQFVP